MRVKRYVVDDLPDALPLIRTELGKDAVILNTKEIYVGGFLGMFRKKKMEVIAAVESNAQGARPASDVRGLRSIPPQAQPPAAAALQGIPAAVAAAAAPLPQTAASTVQRAYGPSARPSGAAAASGTAAAEAPAGGMQSDARAAEAPRTDRSTVNQADVLEEIKQMKALMVKLARDREAETEPAAFEKLRERLTEQEVAPEWIELLVNKIKAHPDYRPDDEEDAIWRTASELLLEWMRPSETEGIREQTRIVHVVGPTGVGKTTTIAKLAAEQVLRARRKVGFITSDTYRIAAVDQLRTYANILNVPLEVVFSPLELARAFKQLEDREIIFMDTAGRNFRNELYVSEVSSLIRHDDEQSDTFLVLSLTSKTRDMESVASRFLAYGVTKVIYTKHDETDAVGAILNLAMQHNLKTAYVTTGQNVPDDIEPFNSESYVAQLLGAAADD